MCVYGEREYIVDFSKASNTKQNILRKRRGMKMKQCDRDSWQVREKKKHYSLLLSLFHLAESLVLVGVMEAHLLCNTFSLLHTITKLCYNKVESQQLSSSSVGYFKFFLFFLAQCYSSYSPFWITCFICDYKLKRHSVLLSFKSLTMSLEKCGENHFVKLFGTAALI